MKILLFGISNVGKSTIGQILSEKLGYDFDDLDAEIIKQYGGIDNFQAEYPFMYERHKKRGEILKQIIDKYTDNVVIAVSVINYARFVNNIIKDKDILAVEITDKPENILKRLVYSDENDEVHKLEIKSKKEEQYYLREIKTDFTYYKKVYYKIENKFDIDGKNAEEATENLLKYIKNLEEMSL